MSRYLNKLGQKLGFIFMMNHCSLLENPDAKTSTNLVGVSNASQSFWTLS